MLHFLKTFPFTLLMCGILIAVALWTRTHAGPLDSDTRHSVGFSALHLPRGDWGKLFSSVFFTVGGVAFYASLAMLALGVGAAERSFGTWRTVALYWGIHLVTLVSTSLLITLPLRAFENYRGTLIAEAVDVGPSAGYYGCLGAACWMLPMRWRLIVVAGVVFILAARLTWSLVAIPDHGRAIAADLAHIIAFPLGILTAGVWLKQ